MYASQSGCSRDTPAVGRLTARPVTVRLLDFVLPAACGLGCIYLVDLGISIYTLLTGEALL
jgi:hypothetical protein